MFDAILEQRSLLLIGALIVLAGITHFYRLKLRKTETQDERMLNDFYAVASVAFAFTMFTFVMMMDSPFIWSQSREVIDITTLVDAKQQLQNQYQDLQAIRLKYNNSVGLLRTFVLVIGGIMPMILFRLFKHHYQFLKKR